MEHEPDSPSLHSSLSKQSYYSAQSSSTSQSPPPLGVTTYTPAPLWLLLILLIIIPLLTINNFFGYHAPGAIGASLQRYFGLDAEQFGDLFTIYSAPNVFLVFVGGVWIDRAGVITTSLLFNSFMLIGMVLFALAPAEPEVDEQGRTHASRRSMAILLLGRLLLGIGGECLCAASASMLARWFRTGWLTFACGVNQGLVQLLGSATAFYLLPRLMVRSSEEGGVDAADSTVIDPSTLEHNVRVCLWVTAFVCVISLVSNIIYAGIEWRYGVAHIPPDSEPTALEASPGHSVNEYEVIRELPHTINDLSPSVPVSELTAWQRVRSFSVLFWLVLTMHCLLSPILYTFTAFGPVALMERYGCDEKQAGEWTSLLYVAIVLSPLCGALIDAVGYRAWWQVGASAMIPILLSCMYLTNLSPAFIMTAIGIAYAVTECNGLAMIAVAVPTSSLGTAYGLLGCGISAALLFEPYAVGAMKVATGSYDAGTMMFIYVTTLGALCSLAVGIWDRNHGGTMTNRPIKEVQHATEDY